MDGIIILDKPIGITSHDAVNVIRRLIGQKRVGHCGTLDPLASGILILCLGRATRLAEFLTRLPKEYDATLLLGVVTSTQDITGEKLREDFGFLTRYDLGELEARVKSVLAGFDGEISQEPPAYSAVRQGGRRLYELSRAGIRVSPSPRKVRIESLTVNAIQLPRVSFTVRCSSGTYIRTLCHDAGAKLGLGGCLEQLRRTAVGPFDISKAVPLGDLKQKADVVNRLLSLEEALRFIPQLKVCPEEARLAAMGQKLKFAGSAAEIPSAAAGNVVWLSGEEDRLVAIGKLEQQDDALLFHPKKVFANYERN